jgi:hypothetical protein
MLNHEQTTKPEKMNNKPCNQLSTIKMNITMKKRNLTIMLVAAAMLSSTACKKENSLTSDSAAIQAAVENTQAISLGVAVGGDSIYVINSCNRGSRKDSVAFSSLPVSVTTYLNENYGGYTPLKAVSVKNSGGILEGYVTAISFNGSPVGLKFDAMGAFVKVLEQREGHDLLGHGRHGSGRFHHRGDGARRDTIALTALPTAITTYLSSNYGTDTLVSAFKGYDNGIVVISKNNGVFATSFNAVGTFINRAQLPAHRGRGTDVAESALPTTITSYLSTTYPNYVFAKAFVFTSNNATQGYVVIVEANSTKYAVQFDAAGAFVKAKTIR